MLSTQALDSALVLAERYDEKNIVVRPVAGTPLDVLVKNSATFQFQINSVSGNYLSSQEISEQSARPNAVSGLCNHELDKTELVQVAKDAVLNHLKFARIVVVPEVTHFVEAIGPLVQEIARNPLQEIEVVVNNSFGFLDEPGLINSIERARDIPVSDVKLNFAHEARSDEEVLELISTGQASLDQVVVLYASKLPEGALSHIFATLFTQIPQADDDNEQSFQQLLQNPDFGLARALVTYLVARKLWDNPPDDANLSARQYEDLMVEFRDQAALALLRERYRQDLNLKAGVLVESIRGNKITVNGNVYKEWIANGGSNEVLFGLSLSRNPALRAAVIDENGESYKLAWQNHVAMSQATVRNQRFERTKDLLEREFQHYIAGLSEEALNISQRPEVISRFEHALAKTRLEETDPENLYSLVLRLFCKALYHKTQAHFILETIQRVAKQNPDMSPRQAAGAATVEYVAKWIGSYLQLDTARL